MGGLRETGGLPLFSPEGRTYSPPVKQAVVCLRHRALSEGGLRLLRQPPDNATAPAGAAVIVCADGKFPATGAENWGRNSLPYVAACLRKPATGSFAAEMDSALAPSIFSFTKEKQKKETR